MCGPSCRPMGSSKGSGTITSTATSIALSRQARRTGENRPMDADQSAAKRTALAGERTMLAWWRTALASLAVALAVGRFLPEIAAVKHTWPYVLLGLGFAAYAAGLFVFGAMRGGV